MMIVAAGSEGAFGLCQPPNPEAIVALAKQVSAAVLLGAVSAVLTASDYGESFGEIPQVCRSHRRRSIDLGGVVKDGLPSCVDLHKQIEF